MFREHLKKVVHRCDGGVGSLIMGLDGIAVERYIIDGEHLDIDTIGMEFSFLLGQINKASESLDVGGLREISIKAEQLTIVIRMLTDEYFFATVIRANGNFGKARFLMRTVAPELIAEL